MHMIMHMKKNFWTSDWQIKGVQLSHNTSAAECMKEQIAVKVITCNISQENQ